MFTWRTWNQLLVALNSICRQECYPKNQRIRKVWARDLSTMYIAAHRQKHDHIYSTWSHERKFNSNMNYIPLLPHRTVHPPEKVRNQERNNLCLNRRYFSIVKVLTWFSWVERSIFLETSLKRKRIAQQYHVVQRRRCDWAGGSTLVTSGFVETKTSSTQCLPLRIAGHGHFHSEYFCGFKALIRYHKSTTSIVVQIFH